MEAHRHTLRRVLPQVQVNVSAPERGLDAVMQSQAALAGSQSAVKGSGA